MVTVGVPVPMLGNCVTWVPESESLEQGVRWVVWEAPPLKVWGRGRSNSMVNVASPVKRQSMDRASMVAKNLK